MTASEAGLEVGRSLNPKWVSGKHWEKAAQLLRDDETVIGIAGGPEWNGKTPDVFFHGFVTTARVILYWNKTMSFSKGAWEAQLSEINAIFMERRKATAVTWDVMVIQTIDGRELAIRTEYGGKLIEPYDTGDFARSMTRLLNELRSPADASSSGGGADVTEQLAKLRDLHAEGVLSDDQYEDAKQKLIDGM